MLRNFYIDYDLWLEFSLIKYIEKVKQHFFPTWQNDI